MATVRNHHRMATVDALAQALEISKACVAAESGLLPPVREADALHAKLDLGLGEDGCSFDELVVRLRAIVEASPNSSNHRFLNTLFGTREPAALVGEWLAAVSNVSMYTYKVAGPQVLIEQELISRMSAKVGYQSGEGTFTPGGSLSNLTAMLLARNEAVPNAREDGLSGTPLTVYTSADGHYSTAKNAGILGLGRAHVRRVGTDSEGRMKPDALAAMIDADRAAGLTPVFINATAGTTELGAFDPIRALARVAKAHGVWLHVDGALGGTLLMSTRHRRLLDGCEHSDSFTWDAHKMMGVPIICSAILVRERGLLQKHLNESANYLFQTANDDLNPGVRSIQCGRRNDALKLWAAWKLLGDAGYDVRVDKQMALSVRAAAMVDADPDLVLVRQPQSINVCFEVRGSTSVEVCAELDRTGVIKVGYCTIGDRCAIRLVCVNPDMTDADLEQFFGEVKACAARLVRDELSPTSPPARRSPKP